ncbi:5-formyltetrahydrofolate cyclo-ligase [Arthrobacter sp. N1]|uniref:5-formyltetrahydrofolate cyclo-ligase n=1 Tax=Arthrobacter sp. N1 TaxID=619291 RepID=UPI003BB057D0
MTLLPGATGKARLRSALRTARAALEPGDRRAQSVDLARVVADHADGLLHGAGSRPGPRPLVTAYLAADPEPDTAPLLAELRARGIDVVLPVCDPGYRLSWVLWSPDIAVERSVRAPVLEPVGPRRAFGDLAGVGLILVPALGVDRSGHRVGQGGGHYDRFLAEVPSAVPRWGVVYRSEVLADGVIPVEPHDQRLDGIFTADGPLYVRQSGAAV